MIVEAGKWVIKETCRQLRDWQASGAFPDNGFVAFNVSPKQLLDNSLIDTLKNAYNDYAVTPKNLVMEITETVIINKPEKVKKILNELKGTGIRLALDDFGTGYSSLSYLQNYPFDHIKIDKSFIDDLTSGSNDSKITKAIVALADSLDLKVTAEGVEDTDALDFIKAIGTAYYQGYFLSRPLTAEKAIAHVKKNTLSGKKQGNVSYLYKNPIID